MMIKIHIKKYKNVYCMNASKRLAQNVRGCSLWNAHPHHGRIQPILHNNHLAQHGPIETIKIVLFFIVAMIHARTFPRSTPITTITFIIGIFLIVAPLASADFAPSRRHPVSPLVLGKATDTGFMIFRMFFTAFFATNILFVVFFAITIFVVEGGLVLWVLSTIQIIFN